MQTLLKDVGECLKAMGLLEFYEYLVMVFWVFVFFGGWWWWLFVCLFYFLLLVVLLFFR